MRTRGHRGARVRKQPHMRRLTAATCARLCRLNRTTVSTSLREAQVQRARRRRPVWVLEILPPRGRRLALRGCTMAACARANRAPAPDRNGAAAQRATRRRVARCSAQQRERQRMGSAPRATTRGGAGTASRLFAACVRRCGAWAASRTLAVRRAPANASSSTRRRRFSDLPADTARNHLASTSTLKVASIRAARGTTCPPDKRLYSLVQ